MLFACFNQLGCASEPPTAEPIGLLVDAAGGIYWARAPVGYFSRNGQKAVRSYAQSIGLEENECPLFAVDLQALTRILHGLPASGRDVGRGRIVFLFTFFFSDGKTIKYTVGKRELPKAIAELPAEVSGRLKAMFEVADKANNPD